MEGFICATRARIPTQDGEPYIALYQMQSADLTETFAGLKRAARHGRFHMSDALQMDPPPTVRILKIITKRAHDGPRAQLRQVLGDAP